MDTVGMFEKYTTDYLKKMENLTIPENATLVTMDVTSLYTNILHDDGIAACRKIWEQRTVQEPPTRMLSGDAYTGSRYCLMYFSISILHVSFFRY